MSLAYLNKNRTSKKINVRILQMITKLEFRDTNKWVIVYTKFFFFLLNFFLDTSIIGEEKFE